MKYLLAIVIMLSATFMLGQETDVKYQTTEVQFLRMKVVQLQAQVAQKDLFIAQQNLQFSFNALKMEAEKVKKENGWPTELLFDADKLIFIDAPKPITPSSGVEK